MKQMTLRDGPLRDGAPTRVKYDIAEISDLTVEPWTNSDGTPADDTSISIQYTSGDVGIGVTPTYGLHLATNRKYAKDFTASGGTVTQYSQVANDGVGNFHQYWNTNGTSAPTRTSTGYVLEEEFTANSAWYQVRGADTGVIGSAVTWVNIHYYNMATGQHWFPEYGQGTFPDNSPAYLLGVTGNGTVVEVDPDTLGGDANTDEQDLVKTVIDSDTIRVGITNGNSIDIGIVKTYQDMYEYRDLWAEEGGRLVSGSAQWSYGNGATGYMGLTIDDGWEVEAMYFQADTYPATATVQVDLMNYGNTPSNAAANTITSITLSSATDGGGGVNNGYKYMAIINPTSIQTTGGSTVIGFITRTVTGSISDVRVGARLRRSVGSVVTSVSIS